MELIGTTWNHEARFGKVREAIEAEAGNKLFTQEGGPFLIGARMQRFASLATLFLAAA